MKLWKREPKYPKVLVGTYTYRGKSYCDERFIENLLALDWPNKHTLIVDNTRDMCRYVRRLEEITGRHGAGQSVEVRHVKVGEYGKRMQPHATIAISANVLRGEVLSGGFDYLLLVESDVLPPKDAINRLIEVGREHSLDVVGGLYHAVFHETEWFDPDRDKVIPNRHILSGCTLYSRKSLEMIPFRYVKTDPVAFPDAYFSMDASDAGLAMANYTGVRCRHEFGEMNKNGSRWVIAP